MRMNYSLLLSAYASTIAELHKHTRRCNGHNFLPAQSHRTKLPRLESSARALELTSVRLRLNRRRRRAPLL